MKEENSIRVLSIKILISTAKKALSKKALSQNFKRHPIELRTKSINWLLKYHYIESREMPMPGVKRTPTFYFITEKGQGFLEEHIQTLKQN